MGELHHPHNRGQVFKEKYTAHAGSVAEADGRPRPIASPRTALCPKASCLAAASTACLMSASFFAAVAARICKEKGIVTENQTPVSFKKSRKRDQPHYGYRAHSVNMTAIYKIVRARCNMGDWILALLIGFILDLLLGDPVWLHHPVCLIGKYISFMEKKLRKRGGNLRRSAVLLTASTVLLTMAVAAMILWALSLLGRIPLLIGMALLDWMGIAVTCMAGEARGVEKALQKGVEAGRTQVSRIVGRDTQSLNEEEIIKATVETVAENTTDGVISPLLYAAIGGPVLLWSFKAANTLDSMVGYLDEKYRDIGWSSARLDDIFNYVPARITAGLMCLSAFFTGMDGKNALRIVRRDHANHKSPNCAWSEAAAAGALHIQLGGTHDYFGKPVEKPAIGDADRPAERADIGRANKLLYGTSGLMLMLILLIAILL